MGAQHTQVFGDRSVGRLATDGRWSGVGSALHWISDRLAVIGDDPVVASSARAWAPALAAEPETVTVLGPRDAGGGFTMLEAVVPIAVPPGTRGRLAVAGAGDPVLGPAARLARELSATIVAPIGDLVLTPGGALFAVDGWVTHDAEGAASGSGRRVPTPEWEPAIDEWCGPLDRAARNGLVVLPVPAGAWIFADVPGTPPPDLADPACAVPLDASRPVLLVGRPGLPEPDLDMVHTLLRRLPAPLLRQLVLAPYGPAPGIVALARRLAGDLHDPVDVSTGLPALDEDDRMISIASGPGSHWWQTLNTCLSVPPIGPAEPIGPVRGMEAYPPTGDRTFRLGERWVAEITQSGLWVRPPGRAEGADVVRGLPWDPSRLRVFVGVPGEPPDHEVLPLLGALTGRLPVDVRRRVEFEPEQFAPVARAGATGLDSGPDPAGPVEGDSPPGAQRAVALRVPRAGPVPGSSPHVGAAPEPGTSTIPQRAAPSRRRAIRVLAAVIVIAVLTVVFGFPVRPDRGGAGVDTASTSATDAPPVAGSEPTGPGPRRTTGAPVNVATSGPGRSGPVPRGAPTTRPTEGKADTSPGVPPPGASSPVIVSPTPVRTIEGAVNTGGRNLALGAAATASSNNGTGQGPAGKAVDGDAATRWSSEFQVDPQWLAVDLGAAWQITEVRIQWEKAYATGYRVEVSLDGSGWTTIHSTGTGTGGITRIAAEGIVARHVRMVGTARAAGRYGYSIWELEVR